MSTESLPEAFQKIILVGKVADPMEKTAQFVRDVHRRWKSEGGKAAGKPRHSDRYLDDQLRATGSPVRSLVPKLTGKTNISPTDGAALIRFFLTHWPEPAETAGDVDYKAVLPEGDVENVAGFIEERLKERATERVVAAIPDTDDEPITTLPGEPAAEIVVRHFIESDAVITVSPEHVFVSSGPGKELVGFRDLMDVWRKGEPKDQKKALIWILDLGGPRLDDLSTRKKYLNVRQLITRFKALEHFRDDQSDERFQWLRERVAIVLLDTYGDWREPIRLKKLPNFSSHHITLTNINPDWAASPNFRALYGSNLERVANRVFNIFLNASADWPGAADIEEDLRYFGYATFEKIRGEDVARGLELPQLPNRYAEALKTVCAASFHNLCLRQPKQLDINGQEAVEQLTYLGLRVLNMDEFLEMY